MDVEMVTAAAIYLFSTFNYYLSVYRSRAIKKKWKRRRWWMLAIHRNRTKNSMENQLAELYAEPAGEFDNFVRMSCSDFEYLLQKISPMIAKNDTDWRDAIPVKVRLAVTLRYLATGDSYRSLHYLFKISSQVISLIVPEVCLALNDVLKDLVKMPKTANEWLSKSQGFNFPHCIGALDGKHLMILPPPHTASEYFNYKGHFSIVLLALVDSDYCFIFADIGCPGRINDGGVYNQSVLKQKIDTNVINLPPPSPLPNSNTNFPYVFLADAAFALSTHIMKPFPGHHAVGTPERLFNQKLSSSRVTIENTFGIMSSVFRIFKRPIPLNIPKASLITMTCVLLHNFLRKSKTSRHMYTPPNSVDKYVNGELTQPGSWRQNYTGTFDPLQHVPRRAPTCAIETRLNFMKYIHENNS
ncbi:unnamed protein product [Acanthoscelides obtectus]|uniref:DDE Tnp4 domain-containing protein n=1 Tax=Acanthoscelides obtectus TaxID=200917 RepID=A0A9P0LPD4_ACAOB|nr:unnamed protein product [Acanthoscelides obtectus]CAK1624285.1 Protein ALP1-like [Acanthoscelides obtectus]